MTLIPHIIVKLQDNGQYKLFNENALGNSPFGDRFRKGNHGAGWPWALKPRPAAYDSHPEAAADAQRVNDYIQACARATRKGPRKRH